MATETLVAFIRSIGIVVHEEAIADSLLPGIAIRNGELVFDPARLAYPGDLLHEAGHIAVVPAAERAALEAASIGTRKDAAAEEMMAIAWSYAACLHLGLDPRVVFHDHGYQQGGSHYANEFGNGRYFGLPMLQWTGLANDPASRHLPPDAVLYPKMLRWLRA